MKLITTALGSYLTGDEIADAVLEYSHALARNQDTDLVDIPVVVDHTTSRLRLTIGWLVQLHTLESASDRPELVEPATTQAPSNHGTSTSTTTGSRRRLPGRAERPHQSRMSACVPGAR